jgi:hypothetical protein
MLSTSVHNLAALISGLAVATQAVQLNADNVETMMAQAANEAEWLSAAAKAAKFAAPYVAEFAMDNREEIADAGKSAWNTISSGGWLAETEAEAGRKMPKNAGKWIKKGGKWVWKNKDEIADAIVTGADWA